MSDILEPVTLGVPVEYFGISLQTEGLTREKKALRVGETIAFEKSKSKTSRNKSRRCTAVEQCNVIWWQVIIEFVL